MKLNGASGSCLNLVGARIKSMSSQSVTYWVRGRRKYARPAAAAEQRWPAGIQQEPGLGAHLATSRLGYTHHGIYVGNGKVVHYAGLSRYWCSGPVEEVTVSDFLSGHPVRIVERSKSTYSAHEIVRRARSRVGEHGYRLLTNNCEHFCNWCVSGLSHSAQIERSLEFSSRALSLAASIITGLQRIVAWHVNWLAAPTASDDRSRRGAHCTSDGGLVVVGATLPEVPRPEICRPWMTGERAELMITRSL